MAVRFNLTGYLKLPHLGRLRRLAVVLERIASDPKTKNEFDMSIWAHKTVGCGTHHCAVGWGTTDPVLRRQGLRLSPFHASAGGAVSGWVAGIRYKKEINMSAAMNFFGLRFHQACDLFGVFGANSYDDRTRIQPVIKRIKRLVAAIERERERRAAR